MNVSVTDSPTIAEGVRAQITAEITTTNTDFVIYYSAQGVRE